VVEVVMVCVAVTVQWRTTRSQCSHIDHALTRPRTNPTNDIARRMHPCLVLRASAFTTRRRWGEPVDWHSL